MTLPPNHGHIEPFTLIRRERTLPRPGEILKRPGQSVNALDVVARARVPQNHHIINVAERLRVPVGRVNSYILKQPGESVEEGELIAARRTIAGLRRVMVRSPVEGEVVESGGGIVILEGEPEVIEVRASMPGTVVEVVPPWGVVVEARGARVQLAWGWGEMGFSELKILHPRENGEADPAALDNMEHRSTIVAVTAPLSAEFLRAAAGVNVEGVVGASMDAGLVPLVEELGLTVGLSEGFGRVPMPDETAELLRANNGRQVTLDPGSGDRWRGVRPEIIICMPGEDEQVSPGGAGEFLEVGDRVRLLRGPHRGAVGKVTALPERPRQLPSGVWAVGAEVELKDSVTDFVPFANLEHLG